LLQLLYPYSERCISDLLKFEHGVITSSITGYQTILKKKYGFFLYV